MSLTNSNIRLTELKDKVRQTAVAGTFYPDDPETLKMTVETFLQHAEKTSVSPKAIIAPHAGYVYSGPIAANAYVSLLARKDEIKRVVLLGPAHRVYVKGLALSSATSFATPLGKVKLDLESLQRLKQLPSVSVVDEAHAQEHSLEVHLPFLQSTLKDFILVPIVVGDVTTKEVTQVLELLWGGGETLIVISSDLSHYHDYKTATQIDKNTSDAIQAMRLDEIGPKEACGCRPMHGLLNIARQRGMRVDLLDLRNSGDTAGTRDRVVGYGSYAFSFPNNDNLTADEKDTLHAIARESIELGLKSQQAPRTHKGHYSAKLKELRATFVTLKLDGKLRGCIGTLQAISPLVKSIADNAFKAAFHDPRFKPLTKEEFVKVELSISILTPKMSLPFSSEADLLQQLRPGVDGLVIEKGQRSATFLPAVWETLATPEKFLSQLKLKAGIDLKDTPEKAWRYQSESF